MKEMFSLQRFLLVVVIYLLMKFNNFLNNSRRFSEVEDGEWGEHALDSLFFNLRTSCTILVKLYTTEQCLVTNILS